MHSSGRNLIAGARGSPLSCIQVEEVATELRQIYPHIEIESLLFETKGDRDRATSLKTLGKCNFFTQEIDTALLQGRCRIAIHSAKDLPEPLEEGLTVVALTRGVESFDSVVLRDTEVLQPGMRIATSSHRREEAMRRLCPDLEFVDIRGPVGERIATLYQGEVDGVVVAEAALIRLNLCHLNRLRLPGETPPYQGQLAVLARSDDLEMQELFAPLDVRCDHRILYLGLDPRFHLLRGAITHCPLIEIVPLKTPPFQPDHFTHILFTSKSAVRTFFEQGHRIGKCEMIAIGEVTAAALRREGHEPILIAEEESSEGLAKALDPLSLEGARLFWPHSSLSRRVLPNYLAKRGVKFEEVALYETRSCRPNRLPSLDDVDEIAFTSPSTVDAFFEFYGALPSNKSVWTQGPITRLALLAKAGVQQNEKSHLRSDG